MIYSYVLDFEPELPLGYLPVDCDKTRETLARLYGVSSQIRCEMHAWLSNAVYSTRLYMTEDCEVLPLRARSKHYVKEWLDNDWEDFDLGAPRSFKFWHILINLNLDRDSGTIGASIDFRRGEVSAFGTRAGMEELTMTRSSLKEEKELSPEAVQTTEESLAKAMQVVAEQEGFDGFTFGDIHLLLKQLSVSSLEPSGDIYLEFQDSEAESIETGEE